ncbi:MAG: hypothetical protein KDI82_07270 [Gammaproteobacteria bacterium]|nr:hypothetical protein [Gammaproteobacteria bacterium]
MLVSLLGVAAYLLASAWPTLFPPETFNAAAVPGCDLNVEPCVAYFDNGRSVRLALSPRPLAASRPLDLQVLPAGMAPTGAVAGFSGVDMNMGRLEIPLQSIDGATFAVQTMLPACIRSQMTWRVVIALDDPQALYRATFEFDVNRR